MFLYKNHFIYSILKWVLYCYYQQPFENKTPEAPESDSLHFIEEETEVQYDLATCPASHSSDS